MQMPIIYYPLTILCIDDDESVLKTFKPHFCNQYNFIPLTSPNELLVNIENSKYTSLLASYLEKTLIKEYSDDSGILVKVNFDALANLANTPEKHSEIGIVMSDYIMPDKNGIDFFEKINHLNFKQILFTEYQDYQKVLSAFNSGIIDRFFLKSHENLIPVLQDCVQLLSQEYFITKTQPILNSLEIENKLPSTDPIFANFFLQKFKENKIQEYYLISDNGSFLLINDKKERLYLVVHTDNSLDKFTNLYNENVFNLFTAPILKRDKVPFFGINVDPVTVRLDDWDKHLYTPEKLTGQTDYYWSIIKEKSY